MSALALAGSAVAALPPTELESANQAARRFDLAGNEQIATLPPVGVEHLGSPTARPGVLVARASEIGEVERFLTSAGGGGALVLCGEAGIGKSALWEVGVKFARANGVQVLCARASEADAQLSFAGLADLLVAVDLEGLAGLPVPQRHALEVAVRRADSDGEPPDPLTIAAGLLGALRLLSGRSQVLVAIDDLPWLDLASAAALRFAARRLRGWDVRFLVSRRDGGSSELERALAPRRLASVQLGPLSFGAISRVVRDRLRGSLPRRVLRQVFESAQGNPLFALELGRSLLERGLPEIGAPFPVPEALEDLFGARVAALAPEVRRALLAVALSGSLSAEELGRVVDPFAIEDAQAAGVLIVEGTHVRAPHPLLAAAASAQASPRERRELHLALARVVSDEVLRARHLATTATQPDAGLADGLSAAAAEATRLGALHDAIELARHALRLTPSDEAGYDERVLVLAQHLIDAGEHLRASELLSERIDTLPAGPARAAAHLLLAEGATASVEQEHLAEAIAESAGDPEVRARALAAQAQRLVLNQTRRIVEAEELAREALRTARGGGPEAERRALVVLAWARVLLGRSVEDLLKRSHELAPVTSSLYEGSVERPAGVRLAFRGEVAQAREIFRHLLAGADERGESRSGLVSILQLSELALRAGDTAEVARLMEDWDQWSALEPEIWVARARIEAMLAALRGEPGRAAELAARVLGAGELDGQTRWDWLEARRALGIVALLEREPERAIESLDAVWQHALREGVEDPGAFPVVGDLVEALAETGRPDEANELIGRLDRLASEQRHPWGLATVKRSNAVVKLANRYDDDAAAQLAAAAADYRGLGLGFDSARALLFLGRAQRRAKKQAAARDSLNQARAEFEQLGCSGWAELAGAELARVGGRARAANGDLTPSEQRVAQLVAGGLSNKKVAAQLFVSVYTVEAHLKNAYAKLGIRSRTQLTQRLGTNR